MYYWLIGSLITAAVTVTGVAVSRLVWLAGLKQILRGTQPEQRPTILRAYATCQPSPPGLPRGPRAPRKPSADRDEPPITAPP